MTCRRAPRLCLSAIGLAAAGCAAAPGPYAAVDVAPAWPPATRASTDEPSARDARIADLVRRQIRAGLVWQSAPIEVDCRAGIVTLRGEVPSVLAREHAAALARVADGARAVVDRLVVAAAHRSDIDLDFAVASVLARDPVTSGQPIAARTTAGTVRLAGGVDSNAARRAAEDDALSVPGVRAVADDLIASPSRLRTDARLASEAGRSVHDDVELVRARIHASASGGTVVLTGTAGSWGDVARAESDAWEASPSAVDAGGLRVEHDRRAAGLRSPAAASPSDADVSLAVADALLADPRLQGFMPEIDVRLGGVVTLTGAAGDAGAAQAAVEDAHDAAGVRWVHDDLAAPGGDRRSDALVLYEARSALARDPELGRQRIDVGVWRGRVLLRGIVATETDRLRAIEAAAGARGVQSVEDALVVHEPAFTRRSRP